MDTKRSEILLHPVRLRIVLATAGDEVTTAELALRLPDVAQATLYRHIARLVSAGMLEIVAERQARGATERTYRLVAEAAHIGADDAAQMTGKEHIDAFTVFAGALIDSFARYLATPDARPHVDGVSYRQISLWQSDEELREMIEELSSVVQRFASLEGSPDRRRRLFSSILIPTADIQTSDRDR